MKRILLSVAVAALLVGGVFGGSAMAHGPGYQQRRHHHHYRGPVQCYPSIGYRGGSFGYLGGSYGYRGGYVPYGGYGRVTVPYGAGYSGGWQPYQSFYYQQPRFGMYLGF